MAASEEARGAPAEAPDVARGLENLPVSAWPPGAGPPPFQYSPDHVAGPGADADPSQVSFPGCGCRGAPCRPGSCACLRGPAHYEDDLSLRARGAPGPLFECNALCACGEACGNRVVQRGLRFRLQVFWAGAKGWGLRTLDPVPEGQFVCEYAGEVLGRAEAQRRLRLQAAGDANYIIAVREHVRGGQVLETFVDPARVGNVGRFLNHSCEPNLLMVPVRIDSMVPKLALFAARHIWPQEELSYDYSGRFLNPMDSADPERPEPGEARKPCYCGAAACASFLPFDRSLFGPGATPTRGQGGAAAAPQLEGPRLPSR
ncbi:Histone-lysine N-methyltransferase SETMAR [Galemys pyrenaicus]|uniref:Histone-lysine N-methyltransferase SETMAR n=1 Tax=Galemys pyrenaicus TaxID=202257 RepID=A0A8J6A813_GALPY|nr:Histone-lysine N-methyltransferase SETMAR [Galemys pyrenaicus]